MHNQSVTLADVQRIKVKAPGAQRAGEGEAEVFLLQVQGVGGTEDALLGGLVVTALGGAQSKCSRKWRASEGRRQA